MPIINNENVGVEQEESTSLLTPLLGSTTIPSYQQNLKLSQIIPQDPDTIRNALLASANNTETLTGLAGLIRAGFPIKLVEIMWKVSRKTRSRFALRAGVPPNSDKGEWTDFKSIHWKTKTYPGDSIEEITADNSSRKIYYPASFLAGTIPELHVFRRTSTDSLPKKIPTNCAFVPLTVRLREILYYAQTEHPIYTNLRIEDNFLKFNMPHAPVKSNREFVFSLDLSAEKTQAYEMADMTDLKNNKVHTQEFMPWQNIYPQDFPTRTEEWCAQNILNWDEKKFGPSFRSALNLSYASYVQKTETGQAQAIKVAATQTEVNGQKTYRYMTGDVDICYIATPTIITVCGEDLPLDPKFTRIYNCNDLDSLATDEFVKLFVELFILHINSTKKEKEDLIYQLPTDQYNRVTKDIREFIPDAGCISLYELLNIYLINREYHIAYGENFGNPIQHGAESANPGSLSSLDDTTYHIYLKKEFVKSLIEIHADHGQQTIEAATTAFEKKLEGIAEYSQALRETILKEAGEQAELYIYEKSLVFNEDELIKEVKEATEANLYVRVHPQWLSSKKFKNEEWRAIVASQLTKWPEYVDKETLTSYKHPLNRLRSSFSKLSSPILKSPILSSPIFASPTFPPTIAKERRNSHSPEFKQGQLDMLKHIKIPESSLRTSTNSLTSNPTDDQSLRSSDSNIRRSGTLNFSPQLFSSFSNLRRKSLLDVRDTLMGKNKSSLPYSK